MTKYVALLRAVNVGGTGVLGMGALRGMCEEAGFCGVRTCGASGNVVFESRLKERAVKRVLEGRLERFFGKRVGVMVRTGEEIKGVLRGNPFAGKEAKRVVVVFLDEAPAADVLEKISGRKGEDVRVGVREIYVFYPEGQGKSKLRIAAAREGTGRNMNTVAKLVEMVGE